MDTEKVEPAPRVRREPPPFRRVEVRSIVDLSPHMRRFVLGGSELEGFEPPEPAASVRLLIPPDGESTIVMPTWTGNQFELPNGDRAPIRTFTPRTHDASSHELTIDVVLHEHGAASDWARRVTTGEMVAVSGPGRGLEIDPSDDAYLLVGDETALPALCQLLEVIPGGAQVGVHVEVAHRDARIELPGHSGATVTWHDLPADSPPGDTLVRAVASEPEPLPLVTWVAGEAAAVQRIRTLLFQERGLPRSAATVRGYWKYGRAAT